MLTGSTLAAGAETAEASAGAAAEDAAAEAEAVATLAGAAEEAAGEVEAVSALAFFSFLAGAAATTTAATGAFDCCSATVLAEAEAETEAAGDSFFATRFTAVVVGLAELIVLVPVELFDIFKRTDLHNSELFDSNFLPDSHYLSNLRSDLLDKIIALIGFVARF